MIPQLWKIWTTGQIAGISLTTLLILICVQGGFAVHGFFLRDRP